MAVWLSRQVILQKISLTVFCWFLMVFVLSNFLHVLGILGSFDVFQKIFDGLFLGCLGPRNLLRIFLLTKLSPMYLYLIAPIKVPGVRFLGAGCGGTWPVASKHALGPHLRSPPQWLVEGGSLSLSLLVSPCLSLSLLVFPSFYLSLSLLEFEIYSASNMYHGNVLILIRCLPLGQ